MMSEFLKSMCGRSCRSPPEREEKEERTDVGVKEFGEGRRRENVRGSSE